MSGQFFLHAVHGAHWEFDSPISRDGSVYTFSTKPTGHTKLHQVLPVYKKPMTMASRVAAATNPASHTAEPLVAIRRSDRAVTKKPSWRYK